MRLLVVEDDAKIGPLIARGLAEDGFHVDLASNAEEATLYVADRHYDCIILDRRLPGKSGDWLMSEWRKAHLSVPVLMLSALDQVEDRVLGLDIGADDYLTKPFAFPELRARVRALIRRSSSSTTEGETVADGLVLDLRNRTITHHGKVLDLTPSEFRVAALLLRNPGRIVTRERMAEVLWDDPWEGSDNAIEAHVKNVRKKLKASNVGVLIHAVRGLGYRLDRIS